MFVAVRWFLHLISEYDVWWDDYFSSSICFSWKRFIVYSKMEREKTLILSREVTKKYNSHWHLCTSLSSTGHCDKGFSSLPDIAWQPFPLELYTQTLMQCNGFETLINWNDKDLKTFNYRKGIDLCESICIVAMPILFKIKCTFFPYTGTHGEISITFHTLDNVLNSLFGSIKIVLRDSLTRFN